MDKLFCLLSFALYLFAPNQYSFLYCVLLFILLLANAFYVFRKDFKIEILGFNSIFSLSLILVTYVYPLFIYQVLPNFSLFGYAYNENVITKATAMVSLAYSFYALGYMSILKSDINNNIPEIRKTFNFPRLISAQKLSSFAKMVILLFLLFIATGGLTNFSSQYGGDQSTTGGVLFKWVWVFFQTFCILLVIINLYFKKKGTNIIICAMMLTLIAVGTRTIPLCVILLFAYAICLKNNYSLTKVGAIGFIAFIFLTIVGRLRGGSADLSEVSATDIGFWAYFEDFIVCSRNQYVIYDHVCHQGTTYGVSSLAYILAVVPFAQSIVGMLFGWTDADMRSESMTTKWEGTDVGLGTHIVGDVYLAFGLIGVIILFYFLGYVVAKSRRYMFWGNWKGAIIYLILLSGAMFMCRGSFFYSLKNIVWSLIIISLFNSAAKRKSS